MRQEPVTSTIIHVLLKGIFFILFGGASCIVTAQSTAINFHKLTNQQGLSQATVNVLYKDKEGFLWIGTDDGLNRFDGKEIVKYYSKYRDTNSLSGNGIYGIAESKPGRLFVCHYNAGITCYDKSTNRFKRITSGQNKRNALSTDRVYGLANMGDGYVWARTVNGLSKINPNDFSIMNFDRELYKDEKIACNIDIVEAGNYIWFGSREKGLLRINKSGIFEATDQWDCKKYGRAVNGIVKDKNNQLFVVSEKGIYKIIVSGSHYTVEPYLVDNTLFSAENKVLLDEKSGKIWVGTSDKGLLIVDTKNRNEQVKITSTNVTDNLLSNVVNYLLKDDEHTVFVGTGRGVNFYSPYNSAFNNYQNVLRNIKGFRHPIYAIHELNDHQLLLGNNKGIHIFNTLSFKLHTVPFRPVNDSSLIIYHFTPFSKDVLLVGTGKGVYQFNIRKGTGTIEKASTFKELQELDKYPITDIYKLNDSIAYIASYTAGMFKWNFKQHYLKHFYKREGVPANSAPIDNRIHNIVEARNGKLIICTQDVFSLFDIKTETFQHVNSSGNSAAAFKGKNIKDAYDDGDNIWIATFGQGLHRWNKKTNVFTGYTIEDGLPNNSVYSVTADDAGSLWLATNNGLAQFNKATAAIKTYTTDDGLPDNEFNGFASTRSLSGNIYFSTLNGIVSINPSHLVTNNFSPPVVITNIEASSAKDHIRLDTLRSNHFIIPASYTSVRIKFAALTFTSPNKIIYKVKMAGYGDWNVLGNTNEMVYPKLPAGSYVFKVMSTNSAGIWGSPLTVNIVVKPRWFESNWFKAIIILLGFLLMYSIYRIRVNELKKEQKIRSRLAIDLHDDLGSTLTSIDVYTNLAIIENGKPAALQKIKESTQKAICDLRDIIWVMDDKRNAMDNLVARICKFCAPLSEANDIQFIKEISPEALHYKLKPDEKRNLYLIIKESINNIIKYAHATEASLSISLIKGKPYLQIKDNGKGFNTSTITEGNGLRNMKTRAAQINYRVDVTSGEGTVISLIKK